MNLEFIKALSDTSSINDAAINALLYKKIFFGHMSVGYNIIAGTQQLVIEDDRFGKFNIQELSSIGDDLINPGLYHSRNGKNDELSHIVKLVHVCFGHTILLPSDTAWVPLTQE